MMCLFEFGEVVNGRRKATCKECRAVLSVPIESGFNIARECQPGPDSGPGTALESILSELGIKRTASCGCDAFASRMNIWGVEGCREHREEILEHLRTAYDSADLTTKLRAGANAIAQGKPLTLAGLLDLAIERSNLDPTRASR